MKQLELHDSVLSDGKEKIGTTKLIEVCLNNAPEKGLTTTDMRRRIRILDRIESANGTLDLEDADAAILQECVGQMRWKFFDRGIVKFCDAIESMKEIQKTDIE